MEPVYSAAIVLQYLAIAILFGELIFALCQKPSETQKHVTIMIVSTILMLIGYCMELQADSLSVAKAATIVSYLGKPFIMLTSFLFLCSYYNRRIPKKYIILLALYFGIFSVLVSTNDYHHLFYKTVFFESFGPFAQLGITRGPLYYVYMFSILMFMGSCLWVILSGYRSFRGAQTPGRKRLALYSTMMVGSSIIGYVVYLSGLSGDFDFTVVGVFFSVLFLFLIFARCRVFDLVSAAKDRALDSSPTALFVFDTDGQMAYRNRLAIEISDSSPIAELLQDPTWTDPLFHVKDRIYSVNRKQILANGISMGRAVELTDVTDSRNYQIRLEHDIRERTEKLEAVQRQMIGSIASMIEARSLETGEHIRRTSDYARMIALTLRERGWYQETLTDEYINLLVSAMPLHDVGKIAISDVILLKPGKLTYEEFEVMKTHSETGAQLIENTMRGLESDEYLEMAVNIARYHHERWDGNGYPENRKGTDIPLEARIAALADCFDAIMSKRCYKAPVERPEAVRMILADAGTHFEPAIVDALVRALNE